MRNAEYFATLFICFKPDVNKANIIIITHCPRAKQNNSAIENTILFEIVAKAIILASMGEEHGLAARANSAPIKNGNKNRPPFLF